MDALDDLFIECNIAKVHKSITKHYANAYWSDLCHLKQTQGKSKTNIQEEAKHVAFHCVYFRKYICGYISWWLKRNLPKLYGTILKQTFNEWNIDGTHYSGLYYKLYDELCRKLGLKITEGFAINEWGLILWCGYFGW